MSRAASASPSHQRECSLLESSHVQAHEERWAQLSAHQEKGLSVYLLASTAAAFLQKSGQVIVISHSTAVKNIIFAKDTA